MNARIGRVLSASLHQAIGEVLPARLEFYEAWLSDGSLRNSGLGLAPMTAVLSFLRLEGASYETVMAQAGAYAGEWTVEGLPSFERRMKLALPAPLRVRAALGIGRGLVTRVYPASRAVTRVRRGTARVDVRGSLFCDVRQTGAWPLCGFYAAAFARILDRFLVPAQVRVRTCRATGARGCSLSVVTCRSRVEDDVAAA